MKFGFRLFLFLISLSNFLVFGPQKIFAADWSYPMDRFSERPSLKGFGQLIDQQFYVGKENLFPNKFYGYHTGIDLEIFPEELNKDVPVFVVSSGTIAFVGHVNGYGGLILEKIDNENVTALYGHLKLKSTNLKTGDSVSAGEKIALLGDAFSSETGGERKHLHFAIYNGSGLYFKGYEDNSNQLAQKWEDPLTYLKQRETLTTIPAQTLKPPTKSSNIFLQIFEFLKRILLRFGSGSEDLIPSPTLTLVPTIQPATTPTLAPANFSEKINLDVPFTPQAPFGDWADPRQQDGCEEAASLMAVYWAQGKSLTRQKALAEILAISRYEEEKFSTSRDTSAQDTAERIIKGYFGYTKFEARKNITTEDIIREITLGNAVIVPLNGQINNNPYYTPPGPERHNLVIRGWDPAKQEFITNDNGTKRGENYRYPKEVLFNAIRDYPTGDHVPIEEMQKSMIVIFLNR